METIPILQVTAKHWKEDNKKFGEEQMLLCILA